MTTSPSGPRPEGNPLPDDVPPLEELLKTVPLDRLLFGTPISFEAGEEWSYPDGPEAGARVAAGEAGRSDVSSEPVKEILMTMDGGEEWSLYDEQGPAGPAKNGPAPGAGPEKGRDSSPPAENPPPS